MHCSADCGLDLEQETHLTDELSEIGLDLSGQLLYFGSEDMLCCCRPKITVAAVRALSLDKNLGSRMHPNLPKLPCGITSFQDLRENDYLYVDKTDLIYDLVTKKRFCLLTRPRRFGKSLLLSTLDCLFRKQMHLFQRLKISALWQEAPCKTITLYLSGIDFKTVDEFRAVLADQIAFSADKNHLDAGNFSDTNPVINLDRFVRQAYPAKVVILVGQLPPPKEAGA